MSKTKRQIFTHQGSNPIYAFTKVIIRIIIRCDKDVINLCSIS
jgi:hypothetical protein